MKQGTFKLKWLIQYLKIFSCNLIFIKAVPGMDSFDSLLLYLHIINMPVLGLYNFNKSVIVQGYCNSVVNYATAYFLMAN